MGEPLSRSSRPLLFGETLLTPQSRRFVTLPLDNFGSPVLLANQTDLSSITTMHPTVLGGVNWLNVLRSATCFGGTFMVHVLSRRAVKRFIDKAVNFFQLPSNSDMAISATIARACPNPALANVHQAVIKAQKIIIHKHDTSIHNTGFIASLTGGNP